MSLLRQLAFNLWYFRRPPWDRGISPPELLEYMAQHPAGRAIDLGCGTGTNVITLAKAGWQVTGVDFAARAVSLARRKIRAARVVAEVRTGDVTHLNGIQGPYDLALDMGCFHSVDDRAAYLDELNRVLAPGGSWLVYGFIKRQARETGAGLAEPDLKLMHQCMRLVWRKDGADRYEKPSAWFHFQKI